MSDLSSQETVERYSVDIQEMHRAIVSLTEELVAIDSYNQRAEACKNKALRTIFEHNRDEEKEHASMLLEWIRRNDDAFSGELKNHLFTKHSIKHR
ncbi:MAG: ferritin [Sideroxydans sp.]|nr:ferritin [Sideroxydans sp.]